MNTEQPNPKLTRRFHQKKRPVCEIGERAVCTVYSEQDVIGQYVEKAELLRVDDAGTVLGTQVEQRAQAFTVYGHVSTTCMISLIAFNGQWFDISNGCYPLGNGHRGYSPTLMRFLGADGLSPFGEGGVNAYAYCSGDPVNRLDPSGRTNFNKFFHPAEKTGITAFMKRNELPKKELKGYFSVLAQEKKGAHIDVYRKVGEDTYNRFRFTEKNGAIDYNPLPVSVTANDMRGQMFVKGNIVIDLHRNRGVGVSYYQRNGYQTRNFMGGQRFFPNTSQGMRAFEEQLNSVFTLHPGLIAPGSESNDYQDVASSIRR